MFDCETLKKPFVCIIAPKPGHGKGRRASSRDLSSLVFAEGSVKKLFCLPGSPKKPLCFHREILKKLICSSMSCKYANLFDEEF